MGRLQGGKGIYGRGGRLQIGEFALRYIEEGRKVGGRSLPFSQGRSKIGNNRAHPLGGAKKRKIKSMYRLGERIMSS